MKDFSTGTEGSEFNKVTRDAKRRAYIQDWIARNQRVLAAGIGTGVLALPLIAQGATSDFVSLSSIHGIRSAQEQADGSLRLTLSNGQQVVLQPDDVIMGKSGEIMISQEAADMIDGLVTVDETAVGGGAGLAVAALAGLTLAAAALARSSSDDDDAAPPPPPPPLPVVNRDDVAGLVFDDVFDEPAPDGSDRITATIGEGDAAVSTMGVLGDDGVWRFAFDPDDLTALQGEQQIAFLAESEVLDDDGDGTGEFDELGSGATTVFVDTIAPVIDITEVAGSDNVLNAEERDDALVVSGTTDAEDGREITVDVVDTTGAVVASGTAAAEDRAWTVEIDATGLDDNTVYTLRASVEDEAGNPATPSEATLETDFTAEVSIDDIDPLTTVNTFFDLEITGGTNGVQEGAEVSVTFAGTDYGPGIVQADGSWSVTVPQADIEALGEDVTEVAISASVADSAGNSDQDTLDVPADFTAPGFAITSPADDVARNADTVGDDLTVAGVSVPGSEVVVSINGDARDPVTAAADGTWSVTIPGDELPGDGSYTISADANVDGAPVGSATLGLLIDTVAPVVTIDTPIVSADVLSADERDEGITISGTATDDGASPGPLAVMVDVAGDTYETTADGDGNWSVDIPSEALEGLDDGDTVEVTATAMDAAGNASAPASETFDTDFVAPDVTVDSIGGVTEGGTISTAELFDADGDLVDTITVSGTAAGAPDGATVTIMLAGTTVALTPTVTDEAWSADIPASEVSNALGDLDSAEITASVQDAAGNTGTGTLNIDVDLSIPTIAIAEPADGTTIGIDAFEDGLTVAGSTTGVPEDQEVTIEVTNDADADDTFTTTATVDADGAWTVTIPASDVQTAADEANFTLTASVSDGAFPVPATASLGLSTDFPPEITLDTIGDDGALIIDDLGDTITFSGGTRGVPAGQEVTVSVDEGDGFSDVGTATVQADGTWSLTVDTEIDGSEVGNEITFRAEVSNAAGRAATPAEESVVGYAYSNYEMFETGRDGDTITVSIFGIDEAFPDGLTAFDVQTTIDPDVVNYGGYPSDEHPGFFFILGNPADGPGVGTMSGVVQVTGAGEVPITDFSIALAQIETVLQDGDDVVEIGLTGVGSGATQLILGSDGADTLVAGNTDAVIRGRGGDDQIDLSAPGSNTVVFEGGSAANGFDTVTGFTLGGALADRISISFDTFGQDELRGNGTDFQVTDGGALGADVGLLVFTTAVADLDDDAAIADAVGGSITGLAENENIYLMIGDGTDAILTAIEGTDGGVSVSTGSGTAYARFEGMGDLSGFSSANVLGFEQFNG